MFSKRGRKGTSTLTIEDVAERLGVCNRIAYKMAKEGKIPALKLYRRWIVPTEAFEKWLNGKPDD